MTLEDLGFIRRDHVHMKRWRETDGKYTKDGGGMKCLKKDVSDRVDIDGVSVSLAALEQCYLHEMEVLWKTVEDLEGIAYNWICVDERGDVDDLPHKWIWAIESAIYKIMEMAFDRMEEIATMEINVKRLLKTEKRWAEEESNA